MYFCAGILPANIASLLETLPNTTEGRIGIVITINLVVGMISMIFFGYYGDFIKIRLIYTIRDIATIYSLLF